MGLQFILAVALLFANTPVLFSKNILAVMPLTARSHFKSFQPLFEEIVKRGHNLTIISGYQLREDLRSNYTHINMKHHFHHLLIKFSEMRHQNRLENLIFSINRLHDYTEHLLQKPEFQMVIKSNDSYDMVITEIFFIDVYFSLGYRFNAPTIGLSAQNLISYYSWVIGNPCPSSHIPNIFLPLTETMSYVHRVINTAYNLITGLYYELVAVPMYQAQMEKYVDFGDKPVPNLRELMSNISVTFVNTHYSFGYIKPYLPNVIETAGLHIIPRNPLPVNIQKFMDDATDGVIYLSLGSLIEPSSIRKMGETFIKILEKLPQRILLKWDPTILPYIPKNFFVQEWMPQVDILSHPKCSLFITHGGLHSLLESLNTSVPFVGIPFFSDQYHNLAIAEYYRIGKSVDLNNIENDLSGAIHEILHDSRYQENIKYRSRLFNERLSSPLDTAMYWVEHVLSHNDVSHLKSAGLKMPWYRYFVLDVFVTFVVSILLVFLLIYYLLLSVFRGCRYLKNVPKLEQSKGLTKKHLKYS